MATIDWDENLEIVFVPKPAQPLLYDDMKANEEFIDLQFEKLKMEELKKTLYDDILYKVLETVRQELPTSTTINDRSCTKKKRSEELEELVSHLKNEISFLREEVRVKNLIIKDLVGGKSLMRDEAIFSHVDTGINLSVKKSNHPGNIDDVFDNNEHVFSGDTDTPIVENEYADTSLLQNDSHKNCEQKINDQLIAVRIDKHNSYISQQPNKSKNSTEVNGTDKRKILIVGDSMLNGIKENGFRNDKFDVNLKYFSGAKVSDIANKMDNLLKKNLDCVVLHVGTNNAPVMPSSGILDEILSMKHHIEKVSPKTKVVISSPIVRTDNGKAALTIKNLNQHLRELDIEIIENSNITFKDLGKKGLHLAKYGKFKLVKNIMQKLNKLF